MSTNILPVEYSPNELTLLKGKISLDPHSAIKQISEKIGREIEVAFFTVGTQTYGIVRNAQISGGEGSWSQAIAGSGYGPDAEKTVYRDIARTLCAHIIPEMAQQPHEVMASLKFEAEKPNVPASYYEFRKLGSHKPATVEIAA